MSLQKIFHWFGEIGDGANTDLRGQVYLFIKKLKIEMWVKNFHVKAWAVQNRNSRRDALKKEFAWLLPFIEEATPEKRLRLLTSGGGGSLKEEVEQVK